MMNRNHIHDTLKIIYDPVFNEGRADLYPDLVAGPYIQHNSLVPDGLDGVMGFLKQVGRVRNEVKRIAIDGDLAFVHVRYLDLFGKFWETKILGASFIHKCECTVRKSVPGICGKKIECVL